ncbi:hypothetical protein [Erwinia sp. ErVv1]|uniref:hypothetical protein n=1 Tax=Erwinia sp. ErVv1 TaxID=1603299 RepID=UPI000832DF73|nr:hypothetical protein [Erwinia sp. ErVv1]
MNIFLNDLVTLNRIILQNAREQFPEGGGKQLRYRATGKVLADDLSAKVCTEIISGETRYQIATRTDGTSWTMTLSFTLSRQVAEIPYVVLSFNTFGNPEEMIFNNVMRTETGNLYRAELVLLELADRDALLRALSDFDAQTTLVVAIITDNKMTNTVTDPKVFYFAENYYPYIYQGIKPPPARLQLILTTLAYQNISYNYYQDYVLRNKLYYLPDIFEVGVDTNKKPMLSFSFSAAENATKLDQVNVTLDYFLLPKVNQQRIANAGEQFSQKQPEAQLLSFASADTLVLQLELPCGKTEEKNALINLQSGIADSFTLPAIQFTTIWDALFSTSPQSLLLKGQLVVQYKGFNPDTLPVKISLDDEYKSKPRDFITQSAPVAIANTLIFKSHAGAYTSPDPHPINFILVAIDNQTFELNAANLTHEIVVKVPVIDLILNPDKKIRYQYDLDIHYVDGNRSRLLDQTTSFEIIYVP